jgi:hypothetical protein
MPGIGGTGGALSFQRAIRRDGARQDQPVGGDHGGIQLQRGKGGRAG